MTTALQTHIATALRDYVTDGVPSSGDYQPEIADIRTILDTMADGSQWIAEVKALLNATTVADARTALLLGSSSSPTFAAATIAGALVVDTSSLVVDAANHRVGIGTATPGKPLDVAVEARFTGALGLAGATTVTSTLAATGAGKIVIGATSTPTVGSLAAAETLAVAATGNGASMSVGRWSADATGPQITLFKARGTTVGGFTSVVSGDSVGIIRFSAATGTTYAQCAGIEAVVSATPSSSSMPTDLRFLITAAGSITATESARLTSEGRFLLGSATSNPINFGSISPAMQVHGINNTGKHSVGIYAWTAAAAAPFLFLAHSRSQTIGSYSALASGDPLGAIRFYGDDGTSFVPGAQILAEVDGATGTSDMPTRLSFWTAADGTSTLTERLRVDSAGVTRPGADNTQTLGASSYRWSVVYAGTGTINTSDACDKAWRGGLQAAEYAAADAIVAAMGAYQWLDAIDAKGWLGARIHVGVTAQSVAAAFTDAGLDPARYAIWTSTPLTKTIVDGDTTYEVPIMEADGVTQRRRQGLRVDQLGLFLHAATHRRVQDLETRVAALEAA